MSGESGFKSVAVAGLAILIVSLGWARVGPLPQADPDGPLPRRPSPINLLGTLDYSLELTERNAELGRRLKEQTHELYEATAFMEGNLSLMQELQELNERIAGELDRQSALSEGALSDLEQLAAGLELQAALVEEALSLARAQEGQARQSRDLTATTLEIQTSMVRAVQENAAQLQRLTQLMREMKSYAEH
jgi:methyl-accepting chemotaxis protein